MLGKENLPLQCQFLSQVHQLSIDRLRNARENLEFAEAYFVMFGQFVRNNLNLIRESRISVEPMLDLGKLTVLSHTLHPVHISIFVMFWLHFLAVPILSYAEAPMLKAGIYFVTICVEKADKNNPDIRDYFLRHGAALTHKMILAAGNSHRI